jgi:hypothetical protein
MVALIGKITNYKHQITKLVRRSLVDKLQIPMTKITNKKIIVVHYRRIEMFWNLGFVICNLFGICYL